MVRLYRLLSEAVDWPADDPRIVEIADILERLMIRAVEAGEVGTDPFDDPFVDLLDATAVESSPVAERLLEILRGAGLEGLDPHRASACRHATRVAAANSSWEPLDLDRRAEQHRAMPWELEVVDGVGGECAVARNSRLRHGAMPARRSGRFRSSTGSR